MTRVQKLPKPMQPMLATLSDSPFDDPGWVFEMKWDGFRLVAAIEKRSVTLYSRNGLIVSDNYKPIAKALEKVRRGCVIDGDAGRVRRSRHFPLPAAAECTAHHDQSSLLRLRPHGKDLRGLPLVERKERLQAVLPKDPLLIYTVSVLAQCRGHRRRRKRPSLLECVRLRRRRGQRAAFRESEGRSGGVGSCCGSHRAGAPRSSTTTCAAQP
jgi:ATP-dependent DNA ligase